MDKLPVVKQWVIPSIYGFEKTVMLEAASEIVRLFPEESTSRLDDMKTAIAEACLNAIEHGNGGNADLTVTLRLAAEKDKISFRIYDQGAAAPDMERDKAVPLSEKWALPRPRGWGLMLIDQLSDYYEFGQCNGKTYLDIIFYW